MTVAVAADTSELLAELHGLCAPLPVPQPSWQRLDALHRPSGQHPYLDEILPALDALRLLLIALSTTDTGL